MQLELDQIRAAREYQDHCVEVGRFEHTMAHRDCSFTDAAIVLGREYGEFLQEVATNGRHMTHGNQNLGRIYQELSQIAAVCVATMEKINEIHAIPFETPTLDDALGQGRN